MTIHIRGLIKDFPAGDGSLRVLHGIDAQINFGELTMLIGPSGCGKTTLISILSGILSATEGSIQIQGHQISDMSDTEKVLFRRRHVGFIFQQFNLLPSLTASQNAALPLVASGIPLQQALVESDRVLRSIGMEKHLEKLPSQLSGGQQQRVAIARALVHQPTLVVCDEPTASLDAKSGHGVMQILKQVALDPKRAVLVVTHDNRIYSFSDRILEMSDGRLIGDHSSAEFVPKDI